MRGPAIFAIGFRKRDRCQKGIIAAWNNMVSKKRISKTITSFLILSIYLSAEWTSTTHAMSGKFIANSATAWVTVSSGNQKKFIEELRRYAQQKSLHFSADSVSAPWNMVGVVILTPKMNEISVINATTPDKFAFAMTIEHSERDWQRYWRDIRAFVSVRHQWQDDLKPSSR